jgi:hypothetical protein
LWSTLKFLKEMALWRTVDEHRCKNHKFALSSRQRSNNQIRFLLVAVKTTTTIKHVDKALTSDSRITRGAGGVGGGGIALASSFSVLTVPVVGLAAVEPFRARGLGAMEPASSNK